MITTDYARIRRELEQLRQEPAKPNRKSPVFDFGLFILLYFFALVLAVTAMLAVGVPIQQYTVFCAVPLAWLGLALLRKAPAYALMITALGAAFLAAVSLCVSQFSGGLCYQAGSRPMASLMIGAGFHAFTGNIACGKVFNIAGMAAAICILGPMVRDAFKIGGFAAFVAALLAVVNPITLGQALTYCDDGFVFQMIAVAAAALAYLAYKPEGRYAGIAKAAAFIAVCLAVNIKAAAVPLCAMLCLFYCLARVIAVAQSGAPHEERTRQYWWLFLYFLAMAVAALCVLGATSYMLNFVRYGNPLHGMLGSAPAGRLPGPVTSPGIHRLPLFAQFFVSLFSPISGGPFADIAPKIPFTFTIQEFNLQTPGASVGGWGIMFSGIFLVSLIIIIRSICVLGKRRAREAKFLLVTLLAVFLPVFFIPGLFSARYYPQLFWLPLAALLCLFVSMKNSAGAQPAKRRRIWMHILSIALCLLLVFNCVTAYNYLAAQAQGSAAGAPGREEHTIVIYGPAKMTLVETMVINTGN
ncbi:MAG: hypothetical protein JW811_10345 [Clostridiales bacterium]|nr:hypothetical protein [Clostridiales bacterium]